ncbi:ATP synthase subunit b [Castellaniella denitrificans]|uniref:F0F1 ATP synthase subunit B family protein n=1 Tax=Castellaniella sp. TaxID=1955812 RepID=UPI002AFF1651|nr:F0F1 ATP synthase subunit B [Castellaniella sp.]
MLIDGFTVAAQVVNFLILIGLLKRFLYRPILDAIDARERHITEELANADSRQAEADRERDVYQRKNSDLEEALKGIMDDTRAQAKTLRQQLLEEARRDADAMRAQQRQNLQNEVRELQAHISLRTRQEVLSITSQALRDLAGADLQERMLATLQQRLLALPTEQRQRLATLLDDESPLTLRSTHELLPVQREALLGTLRELLGRVPEVRFERDESNLCGIELSGNGLTLGWSLAEYLDSLGKDLEALLGDEAAPPSGTQEAGGDGR